jgi:ubiquinone/menaquinone biosynthesis C-methylase UbiE
LKSKYQTRKFSEYWNKRAGKDGEPYKRYILDPIMFKLIGSLCHKKVLEAGCGNGYLAKQFLQKGVEKLILMDISKYNLEYARQNNYREKITFLEQDATKKWKIRSHSMDIVYSNMMLNEIANIITPIKESFRVIRKNGQFVFSVTHPSWDLFVFAQEKAGIKSEKIQSLGNYFRKGYASYVMGSDSKTNPNLYQEYHTNFKVEHYQRPLSDYFNVLTNTGFVVKKIIEPKLTKTILSKFPSFMAYQDHPVGLIFSCIKE